MFKKVKEMLLEYHRGLNFTIYPSFPLITNDPSVLFTNATITPFKHFFGDSSITPHNYALIQKCLRVRGITENLELMRINPEYLSLFEMFGSASFTRDYQSSVEYFLDLLKHIGLPRNHLRFTVPVRTEFTSALLKSGVDKNDIFTIVKNGEFWQHWLFGKNNLVGSGMTAIYSYSAEDKPSSIDEIIESPNRFVEIGNIIHIYGRESGEKIVSIPNEGFEVGIGVERLATTLKRCSVYEMSPFVELIESVVIHLDAFGNKEKDSELPRILVDHLRSIGSLIQEGVLPGNKGHGFVLRKIIRSFLETLWLSIGSIVSAKELVKSFVEIDCPRDTESITGIMNNEELAFRDTLGRGVRILSSNPDLSSEVLRGTYGIRQSLIPLLRGL